jgi:hypothetical protein
MEWDDFFRPIPCEALLSIDITFNAVEYNYVNTSDYSLSLSHEE